MLKFTIGILVLSTLALFGLRKSTASPANEAVLQDSLLGQVVDSYDFGATLHMSTHDDTDELLEAIKLKYKGQAVILDLWGTFCGPCLADFKSSPDKKVELKKLDVHVVYLCAGRSSKPHDWKRIVERDKLIGDHIFLDRTQTTAYMNKFSLRNYPSYILIDKEGNLKPDIISAISDIDIEQFKQHL